MWTSMLHEIQQGDVRALARCISLVENDVADSVQLLGQLQPVEKKIIGITGPPGAGKSTLVDALIGEITAKNESVAVLCIDPSSPFHLGALLGDRIRMSKWYNHPAVFIRSLATRGSLGGLHPRILEIAELIKHSKYDHIIIETVGVGQSEIEIAGLADITVVVVVPEAGDEIQTMKAGLMEIADVFVVNKADRPDADMFVKNLRLMLAPALTHDHSVPIIKTIASSGDGIKELHTAITSKMHRHNDRKAWLYTQRAVHLIQKQRMKDVDAEQMKKEIEIQLAKNDFNLYRFVESKLSR
jgi:LAO/AO transport system kinase